MSERRDWPGGMFVLLFCLAFLGMDLSAGVGVWTTGGPEGGPVRAIAIDPNDPLILYIGTTGASHGGGGVFKSTNQGKSWSPVNNGLTFMEVNALAIARFGGGTLLYAGTLYGGVYRTKNGGATWIQVNNGLANLNVNALAVDPKNPGTVYAGTDGGVFLTTNGGATWTAVNSGLTSPPVLSLAFDPVFSRVYAGTQLDGVFETTNGGLSWHTLNCGLSPNTTVFALEINPNLPGVLNAGTNAGFYSRSLVGIPWPCWLKQSGGLFLPVVLSIASDPNSPFAIYIGTFFPAKILVTLNLGASWVNTLYAASPAAYPWALAVDPLQGDLYAGTTTLGFFGYAGGIWTQMNQGLTANNVNGIALAQSNPDVIYAATQNNSMYKSLDGGNTWTSLPITLGPRGYSVAVDPTDPDIAYAGMDGLFKTTNGGTTWFLASSGINFPDQINAIAIDPTMPQTLYAATCCDGIFKSTNGGASWNQALFGTSLSHDFRAIAIDPLVPSTVYIGGPLSGVVKSTNGGATWTQINTGLTNLFVSSLAIRPDQPDILYAGTESGGIFRSDTGGASWVPINIGLTNLAVYALAIDPLNPDVIYAGTRGAGIWISTNTGATWSPFNAGAPNPFVSGLAISPKGDTLHAATGGSVYDFAFKGGGGGSNN